jgi:hypothetical protein
MSYEKKSKPNTNKTNYTKRKSRRVVPTAINVGHTPPGGDLRRRELLTTLACDSIVVRPEPMLDEPILLTANPLSYRLPMEFVFATIIERREQ